MSTAWIAASSPTLQAHLGEIGPSFKPLSVALNGRTYLARRVSEAELAATSPFQMLADGVEGARAQMGAWSLILIGATLDGAPGFCCSPIVRIRWRGPRRSICRITIAQ